MNFRTDLAILKNRNKDNENLIEKIFDRLTKIIEYEPIKTIIDIENQAIVINTVVLRYYNL